MLSLWCSILSPIDKKRTGKCLRYKYLKSFLNLHGSCSWNFFWNQMIGQRRAFSFNFTLMSYIYYLLLTHFRCRGKLLYNILSKSCYIKIFKRLWCFLWKVLTLPACPELVFECRTWHSMGTQGLRLHNLEEGLACRMNHFEKKWWLHHFNLRFLDRSLRRGLMWTCPPWESRSWWRWRSRQPHRTLRRRFWRSSSSLKIFASLSISLYLCPTHRVSLWASHQRRRHRIDQSHGGHPGRQRNLERIFNNRTHLNM